jgi:hypothetical protein
MSKPPFDDPTVCQTYLSKGYLTRPKRSGYRRRPVEDPTL